MKKMKKTLMFLITVSILAMLTGVFTFVWYQFYNEVTVQPFTGKGNWLVIAIYAVLLYSFTRIYGGYKIGYLKRGDVIFSSCLSMLFVNVLTYFQISLLGRKLMNPMPIVGTMLMDAFVIWIWATVADRLYTWLYPPRQMLLIYGSHSAESLVYKMSTRADKYEICEAVSMDEGLAEVFERILKYEAVVICDVKSELRGKLLKFCFANSIRTYLTPKISDIIVRGADSIHLFDTPLLLCRNHGLSLEQRFVKRAFDLVVALVGLVVTSPFMLITAIAIKLYDGGPPIYKQKRLTIDGKVFEVYKFRSMIMDAEKHSGARLSSQNDDRITPIGKLIRKVRFDELPQVFNILRGDMSIVGPRPERPEIAKQYKEVMPEFDFRLQVKAGLTGQAQIQGKYNTTPYDKLKLDLMYIENYSFLSDLKLVFMTIKILFKKESTEGISANALTAMDVTVVKHERQPEVTINENK